MPEKRGLGLFVDLREGLTKKGGFIPMYTMVSKAVVFVACNREMFIQYRMIKLLRD